MIVDLEKIRRLVIVAMFSDDILMDQLVLKGGNALELVHRLVTRGSRDVDFSLESDFEDIGDASKRIYNALVDRFGLEGFAIHDYQFEPKPPIPAEDWWGGYRVEFKLIALSRLDTLGHDIERVRRESVPVGDRGSTVFKIDISKYEFCSGKIEREIDRFTIFVYTLEMIAIEKVRAICQQMNAYKQIPPHMKRARARDFYDLHAILSGRDINLGAPENLELARQIFDAKRVSLELIGRIEETREFHRANWPAVRDSVVGSVGEEFDFDFVTMEIRRLEPLWKV